MSNMCLYRLEFETTLPIFLPLLEEIEAGTSPRTRDLPTVEPSLGTSGELGVSDEPIRSGVGGWVEL